MSERHHVLSTTTSFFILSAAKIESVRENKFFRVNILLLMTVK